MPLKRSRRLIQLGVIPGIVLALTLSGCSLINPDKPASSPSTQEQGKLPEDEVMAQVDAAVRALAQTSPKPTQDELRGVLVPLAAKPENVEVSISQTPTGLDVDAIEGSVLSGQRCLISQVRDGVVVTKNLAVLSTGKCFVGDQR